MRTRNLVILGLALGASTSLSGCLASGSGGDPAGATYVLGSLDCCLPGTPEKVVQASESALKDQDMHMISSGATGVDGKVVAKTALDTTIAIKVIRQDEKTSKISIRVGTFGDRDLSNDILEKIKAKLPST